MNYDNCGVTQEEQYQFLPTLTKNTVSVEMLLLACPHLWIRLKYLNTQ